MPPPPSSPPATHDPPQDDDNKVAAASSKSDASKKGGGHSFGIHASSFSDFMLKSELNQAITDCGFEGPSEVQALVIPKAILGEDFICQARSGMGKTAVFVITTLHQLTPVDGEVHVIVMCHTRELAYQIVDEYHRFTKYMPDVRTSVFYGGVPIKQNHLTLSSEPPHVVVGTPGRVLALARDKTLKLNHVKHFVLDECDKILEGVDMRRDVQEIFRMTPHEKQVMLFSATLSQEIRPVCRKFCQDPEEIFIGDKDKLTLHGLKQYYVKLEEGKKNRKLCAVLDDVDFNQVVVFVKSVSRAKELSQLLEEQNFPTICIHGGLEQEERLLRYKAFKDVKKRLLVTTDLMGRGIDIERVNVVINYDFPEDPDQYLHRVGRAGRFNTKGMGISFVASDADQEIFDKVQNGFKVTMDVCPDHIEKEHYM